MSMPALILGLLLLAGGCASVRAVEPGRTPTAAVPAPDRDPLPVPAWPAPPDPSPLAAPAPGAPPSPGGPPPPAATAPAPDGTTPQGPPSPRAKGSPPPAAGPPSTPPAPPTEKAPAPVITSRVANEGEIVREVNARLAKVGEIVDRIEPSKLTRDQREIFSSIQDFLSKAREALRTRDVPQAQILAEKALRLADNLATR